MPKARHIELDLLRTMAIFLMIVYHVGFDLWAFWGVPLNLTTLAWRIPQRAAALLFLTLVGMSAHVSWERHRTEEPSLRSAYRRPLRRGLTVLAWGLAITIVTYVLMPEQYVRFGILHLIGVSMLLLPFLSGRPRWAAMLGLLMIATGILIAPLRAQTSLLLPFGVKPIGFQTLDYYPLLPWGGVPFLGLALASVLYHRTPPPQNPPAWLKALSLAGRHSLLLYLIHQPIILLTLWLIMR